jgi:N-acetylmuramoyl-L-alanine amidase
MKSDNRSFLHFVLVLLFFAICPLGLFSQQANDKTFTVVLDAGHGGHDPGNLGNGYFEKNIALKIVLKAGKMLEGVSGINVVYTRKDDTFVDLFERGAIANKAKADLFVSVHCDSHNSDAHGAGTFVLGLHANKQNFEIAKKENSVIYLEDNFEERYAQYDINSPESVIGLTIMQEEFLDQSIALAKMIQDNFTAQLKRKDRKVKQAGFIVLHQTFMPSVLVETGFLTNKKEGSYLNSSKGQQQMGNAIAKAVLKYRENVLGLPAPELVENPTKTKVEKPKANVVVPKEVESETTKPVEASKEPQEEVKTTKSAEPLKTANVDNGVRFSVQIMASSKDLELKETNFKGLVNVRKEPFNRLFRYLYGDAKNFTEAQKLQDFAKYKGYDSAYIVAYKDGERIGITADMKLPED